MTAPAAEQPVVPVTPAALALAGAIASAAALRDRFGSDVTYAAVGNGQQVVHVSRQCAHTALAWLRDDPAQHFDYLTDVTCVEYRDAERQFEVVYQLRSLSRRVDLRLKVLLDPDGPLEVDSVRDLWAGCDWLEREAYDMFGVIFKGHPDLRRILMWETYAEGYPLRKSFPLRGRWSRAEQTRQALTLDTEANYSAEELAIADVTQEHALPSALDPDATGDE